MKISRLPAPEFKDMTGKSWPLQIKLSHGPALKEIGLKLPILASGEEFEMSVEFALSDHETTAEILWVIIKAQAEKEGVTKEVFFDHLDGPTLFAAQEPLVVALAEFSQTPPTAALIRERLPKIIAEREAALVEQIKAINATKS